MHGTSSHEHVEETVWTHIAGELAGVMVMIVPD